MKKFFVYFALFIAALFVVSCGGSDEDGTSDGTCTEGQFRCDGQALKVCGSNGFWTLRENCADSGKTCNANQGTCTSGDSSSGDNSGGIYLGIVGFNYDLYEKDIDLLSKSNLSNYESFISNLHAEDLTALYHADYRALEMMKSYLDKHIPPSLEKLALITFTDGADNGSQETLDTVHNMIVTPIHGLSVEAYTIGLKSKAIEDDIQSFQQALEKLASNSDYKYELDDMDKVKERFKILADSLSSTSKTVNLILKVPQGYRDGTKVCFTFDNPKNCNDSKLYISATVRESNGRTLEDISYHGFKPGDLTMSSNEIVKGYYYFTFKNITYSDGSMPDWTQETIAKMLQLWKAPKDNPNSFSSDPEFHPEDGTKIDTHQASALIMLVLDCTTSLGDNFKVMQDAAREFVRTLLNKSGSGGNGGGNNSDPTDSTEPTNSNNGAADACYDIYECFSQCQDNNCATACVENGDPAGQEVFMTMYNCWTDYCANETTNDGFSNCVVSNCYNETAACNLMGTPTEPGDTSYNSPYGSLSISFSVDQIANDSDGQQSTVGITQAAFATGTYGNGSTSVTPADAYMIQSMASYYEQSQNGQLYKGIQVQQIPVYNQGGQGVGGNPLVILDIPEDSAAVGAIKTSLYQDGQAQLYVVDVNWSSGQISCFHAFGEGTVNITNIGDIANHGALAINGNVTLYSPKNYDGNGDISSQLGVTICNPVY